MFVKYEFKVVKIYIKVKIAMNLSSAPKILGNNFMKKRMPKKSKNKSEGGVWAWA